MDPLSVAASAIGLLSAGAKITSILVSFTNNVQDSPKLAQHLITEIADITAAISALQSYITGIAQIPKERGALVLLENVLTSLTGCVVTYSDLQTIIDNLNLSSDLRTFDKLKWARQASSINTIVQRLQNHKSSLNLLLTVVQCETMKEAEFWNQRLCGLIQELLFSNQDLHRRIKGLEGQGQAIVAYTSDETSTIRPLEDSRPASFVDTQDSVIRFTFEQDLQASRVYGRAFIDRNSMTSFTSTALYTTALSLLSKLSLSQVSSIAFYAIPVYSSDLSNSECYVFGDEGALVNSEVASQLPVKVSLPSQEDMKARGVYKPEAKRRLLGRFAGRRKNTLTISEPGIPVHITHVVHNKSERAFTGMPISWQRELNIDGVTAKTWQSGVVKSHVDDKTSEERLESHFSNICKTSGTSGLSLSVITLGEEVYTNYFGFRDVDAQKVPDGSTTYFIGSLTKAMTAATAGILVEEGKLEWSTRIASILPPSLKRAGNILLDKSTGIQTWTAQPLVRCFRNGYLYSNYAYDMVGRAIEKIEGKSLGACFKKKLFDPLGMTRTSANDLPNNDNAAKAYFPLQDGSPFEVPIPTISEQTLMATAGSVRSCTNDLAKFYTNFMQAIDDDQFVKNTTSTPGSPFKQLKHIIHPHNQLGLAYISEKSYGLGWGQVLLPAALGAFNYNKHLVLTMPQIGEGEFDWIPQLIIHELSGPGRTNIDFTELATEAAKTGTELADKINDELEKRREKDT
ncbi:unnamed protein product [Fusarium graminearum]|nr:unnamed protein product [Fusarium graminearum]CAG1997091.1 unnamed protein product [Fusarium graminearum]